MEIPLSVIQGLRAKTNPELQVDSISVVTLNQFNEPNEYCPLGCDPSRTKTMISKGTRKNKGNFVNVYYRGNKLVQEIPLAVKQETFWREFDELEERNKRSSRNRPQPDRRTNQVHPGSLFA